MHRALKRHAPFALVFVVVAAAAMWFTCSGTGRPNGVDARALGSVIDVSELTPKETKRFEKVVNAEVSPCGDDKSLARALFDPAGCPLAPLAGEFVVGMLKQDYNADEISAAYVGRYAAVKGLAIPIDGSPRTGADKPAITLVIFTDFQCPFCAKAADALNELMRSYPEHVTLVFKNFPIESHPKAELAARAGFAAARQGKFWEMHDTLFSTQGTELTRERIDTMAIGLGLDLDQFSEDLASTAATAAIEADRRLGEKLGVDSTPAVFVNGRPVTRIEDGKPRMSGASGLEERVKEELLRQAVVRDRGSSS
ncbi:MAG: thioredoxin domain-containing protein [Deltaproteobacteria bacterium]|nr:thioredoxin domain-containing protein [Deltaproteobacteria bacterium]